MPKWEYCRLAPATRSSLLRHGQPNTEPTDDVAATIARLGLEGWEMVAHDSTRPTHGGGRTYAMETFYFKREVAGNPS